MSSLADPPRLPLIDFSLFDIGGTWRDQVAAQVDWAASEFGLFYVIGHGIEAGLIDSVLPLVGANDRELRNLPDAHDAVRDYGTALTGLGHRLMTSFGRGSRLGDNFFVDRYTGNPIIRVGAYPQMHAGREQGDDSLLTLIYQEESIGLQIQHSGAWVDVPFVPGSFVIRVGERFERLTSGRYVSAVHRLRYGTTRSGRSIGFKFDTIHTCDRVAVDRKPVSHEVAYAESDVVSKRRQLKYASIRE
jgi:isopenicillin N synthase-like dioxygenase